MENRSGNYEDRASMLENRIENLEDRVNKLENYKDKQEDKIDIIEKQVLEMSVGNRKDFEVTFKMLQEIKVSVDTLKMKPAKLWESVELKLILGIIGAVVAYIMLRAGF